MSTASSTFPAFSSPHVLVCVRQNAWAAYAPAVIACMVSRGWTVSAALEAGKEPFIGMPLLQACGALPHMRCSAGDSGHVDVVICFAESEAETAESSRPGPGGSLRIPADCPDRKSVV